MDREESCGQIRANCPNRWLQLQVKWNWSWSWRFGLMKRSWVPKGKLEILLKRGHLLKLMSVVKMHSMCNDLLVLDVGDGIGYDEWNGISVPKYPRETSKVVSKDPCVADGNLARRRKAKEREQRGTRTNGERGNQYHLCPLNEWPIDRESKRTNCGLNLLLAPCCLEA